MSSEQTAFATRFSALHAFGLAAFAVSLPLFLVFANSPEFFFAHGFTPMRTFVFAAGLGWGVPLALTGAAAALNAVPLRATRALNWGLAGVLAILAVLPTMNRLELLPGSACIVLSFMLGAVVVHFYARTRAVRELFTLLAIAGLMYPLWFAWRLDVFARRPAPALDPVVQTGDADRRPVVWLMFDEFGVEAILNDDGEIDAEHFPNFAALASQSLWFRDATTVAEMTTEAVPALLTGRYPPEGENLSPLYLYHPENAMTILHAAGYRVFAREILTRLCPPLINSAEGTPASTWKPFLDDVEIVFGHVMFGRVLGEWLPSISRQTAHFRLAAADIETDGPQLQQLTDTDQFRTATFDRFLADLSSRDSELHYLHLSIPHREYLFLPSGRLYLKGADIALGESFVGLNLQGSPGDQFGDRTESPYPVALARQRYLLQAGFADYLVGRTVARLRELGAYDRAVFVVTADHGVSFTPGMSDRLAVSPHAAVIGDADHARDILKVPAFIKLPQQAEGRRIDRPAETIDVLPTLLDILGIALRAPVGRSLLDESDARAGEFLLFSELHRRFVAHAIEAAPPGYLAARSVQNVRAENFRPRTKWDEAFLHKDVSIVMRNPEPARGFRAEIHNAADYSSVDAGSNYIPVFVNARLVPENGAEPPAAVAVAVNGRIEAIAIPYTDARGRTWARAMVPESSLRDGANEVGLWQILDGSDPILAPIPGGFVPAASAAGTGE
jgi:hypothetical protein